MNIKKTINSIKSLEEWQSKEREFFDEHHYVQASMSDRRSKDQNALIYQWYKDIANYREDVTAVHVRRECKINYGLPILKRDPQQAWLINNTLDRIADYGKKLMASDLFQVTSIMSTSQLMEYLKCMEDDYPWLESIKR